MRHVLIPLPHQDFDPTECAVPWRALAGRGVRVSFATPDGSVAAADERMLTGLGLGPLKPFLRADARGREAYAQMERSPEFRQPLRWTDLRAADFDGLILPGGHAPGMKEYLESSRLQKLVADFFTIAKPVGAICHGVVLAARSRLDGRSVVHGKRTTALLARQELLAWGLTCTWLGNYYRTYPQTVESEVRAALAASDQFVTGPAPLWRDREGRLDRGFALRDGNYLSARWPGDAHKFAHEFLKMLF